MKTKLIFLKKADAYPNRTIAQIISKIETNQRILKIIRTSLPETLSDQIIDCVDKENKLIVFVRSAAWASQLRFYNQKMQADLHEAGYARLDAIKVRIFNQNEPESFHRPPTIPSDDSIKLIQSSALNTREDDLKRALSSLSQTLKKLCIRRS